MFFILDIMQVTVVTVPIVDLPIPSSRYGPAAITSNVMNHMPTQFQL